MPGTCRSATRTYCRAAHRSRDLPRFVEILRDDIVPLLEEYCYEDFEDARKRFWVPQSSNAAKQRIDTDLFEPERHMDLVQAILSRV